MTLTERIQISQATANRLRQRKAERRLDEIVKVADIADDYGSVDRRGDLAIETHFGRLYQLVSSAEEKQAVAAAYVTWQKCEQAEDEAVIGSVGESVYLLKANNDFWLDDGCGPDGRAA
jgi:hypothetical protein